MQALNYAIWLYRNFRKVTLELKFQKILNVSRRLVNEWIKNYLSGGFDALALKLATGQPSRLSNEQKTQLKKYVIAHAVKAQGGRLMDKDIQKYIQETYDVNYGVRNTYRLVRHCLDNLSLYAP